MPLHDNFFAEPLAALFAAAGGGASGDDIQVELCGVLKAGRTQLRLRVPSVAAAATAAGAGLTAIDGTSLMPPPPKGFSGQMPPGLAPPPSGAEGGVAAA